MSDECKHDGELDCVLIISHKTAVFSCPTCSAEIKRMPFMMKDGKPTIQVSARNLPWRCIVGTVT